MLISKFGGSEIKKELERFEDLIGTMLPEQLSAFLIKELQENK